MPEVKFKDLGLIDYKEAWDYQEKLFKQTLDLKTVNRKLEEDNQTIVPTENHLLFCEHPPVYTIGKSGNSANLLIGEKTLQKMGASFYKINRGGDITFHGPGQLVAYPILDLDHFYSDIHRYIETLEEIFIQILNDYGLKGERSKGETGVWLDVGKSSVRKILAIGVKASRWVTMHGWAFNVNTDLSYFNQIVPCGISNKGVTSLKKEMGENISFEEVSQKAQHYFSKLFGVTLLY